MRPSNPRRCWKLLQKRSKNRGELSNSGDQRIRGNSLGGGNSVGLKTAQLPVTLRFAHPVHRVRDERAGRDLGDGSEFRCEWTQNEAVVLSYEPARP